MVFFDISGADVSDDIIVTTMRKNGIKILPSENGLMLFVTNKDVTRDDVFFTIRCMEKILKNGKTS